MNQSLFEERIRRQEVEESMHAVQGLRERIDQSQEPIAGLRVQSLYQPAERFGGDWLSFTYLKESRQCIILIGDVTGHGIGSGLLSVSIGATIHGALSVLNAMGMQLSVQEKLEYIARAIHFAVQDISKRLNKGMTIALVGLDFEKGQCVVRNHGHPFPYLVRDGKAKVLMARGPLLGAGEWESTDVVTLDFKPGDGIFVYTDGLMDNANGQGRALPRRGLEQLISGMDRDGKGLDELAQYSHGTDKEDNDADDLACLYIEWKSVA
jgi:serine phosphatase RsbU (regulator of sigma subunit)